MSLKNIVDASHKFSEYYEKKIQKYRDEIKSLEIYKELYFSKTQDHSPSKIYLLLSIFNGIESNNEVCIGVYRNKTVALLEKQKLLVNNAPCYSTNVTEIDCPGICFSIGDTVFVVHEEEKDNDYEDFTTVIGIKYNGKYYPSEYVSENYFPGCGSSSSYEVKFTIDD